MLNAATRQLQRQSRNILNQGFSGVRHNLQKESAERFDRIGLSHSARHCYESVAERPDNLSDVDKPYQQNRLKLSWKRSAVFPSPPRSRTRESSDAISSAAPRSRTRESSDFASPNRSLTTPATEGTATNRRWLLIPGFLAVLAIITVLIVNNGKPKPDNDLASGENPPSSPASQIENRKSRWLARLAGGCTSTGDCSV